MPSSYDMRMTVLVRDRDGSTRWNHEISVSEIFLQFALPEFILISLGGTFLGGPKMEQEIRELAAAPRRLSCADNLLVQLHRIARYYLLGCPRWLGSVIAFLCGSAYWCQPTLAQVVINAPPTIIEDTFVLNAGDTLNVADGGQVGHNLRANDGSIVNISGGNVGLLMFANGGSEVNISGGNIGSINGALVGSFVAFANSDVTISGGTVGDGLEALSGSRVRISGGTVGREFNAESGSNVEFAGGEFRLDGAEFTGEVITLKHSVNRASVLTGTLADGSAFVFSPLGGSFGDSLDGVTLTRVPVPAVDLTPQIVNTQVTDGPSGLRAGQTLTVQTGGKLLNNFAAVDATLNVDGGTLGRNTEVVGSVVNISGGSVSDWFYAYSGSEVNITGGSVGFRFEAFDSTVNISDGSVGSNLIVHVGSEANVTGGHVGSIWTEAGSKVTVSGGYIGTGGNLNFSLAANAGSEVQITGGAIGFAFSARAGSNVELVGGEFRLNGAEFTGSSISLGAEDVFTGTLSDGSSFLFSPLAGDQVQAVTLTPVMLPAIDLTPKILSSPVETGPSGLRAGQTLTVQTGGVLRENFSVVNATLNVEGGVVAGGVEVVGGTVNLSSGSLGVGASIDPYVTNDFSSGFDAIDGVVNISGGVVGERSSARRGSVINMSGGTIESKFNAMAGSEVNISGGTLGPDFRANAGSDVELIGGEFRLNGVGYSGDNITLGTGDVFTGTLADGSTFVFSTWASPLGDRLNGVTLTRVALPTLDLTLSFVNTPVITGPSGLRAGQTLTVQAGGVLRDHFAAVGAVLNVEGGVVGEGLEVSGSTVNISGGTVGDLFQAYSSKVNISAGIVRDQLDARSGSIVNIYGGEAGNLSSSIGSVINMFGGIAQGNITAGASGTVNMSGGKVEGRIGVLGGLVNISGGFLRGSLAINNNSTVNISGGTIGGNLATTSSAGTEVNISGGSVEGFFTISSKVKLNLFGRRFSLDGVPLNTLVIGEPYVINERNLTLAGILADGSPFSYELGALTTLQANFFDPRAIVTVTLVVPEPTTGITLVLGVVLLVLRTPGYWLPSLRD
jgi:hypothetical protein